MQVIDLIRKKFPNEVKEFDHSPWNYSVISPLSVEDQALLFVHLQVGRTRALVHFTFEILLTETGYEVKQTHITCPKFKS